jgi:hypothetical protein
VAKGHPCVLTLLSCAQAITIYLLSIGSEDSRHYKTPLGGGSVGRLGRGCLLGPGLTWAVSTIRARAGPCRESCAGLRQRQKCEKRKSTRAVVPAKPSAKAPALCVTGSGESRGHYRCGSADERVPPLQTARSGLRLTLHEVFNCPPLVARYPFRYRPR